MRESRQIYRVFVFEAVRVIMGQPRFQPAGLSLSRIQVLMLQVLRDSETRTARIADHGSHFNRPGGYTALQPRLDRYITHYTTP